MEMQTPNEGDKASGIYRDLSLDLPGPCPEMQKLMPHDPCPQGVHTLLTTAGQEQWYSERHLLKRGPVYGMGAQEPQPESRLITGWDS